jgi:hypothetical protein
MTAKAPKTCRVCGSGSTIDAHLFPRALAHDLRGAEKHLLIGAADAPGRRIVQAGLFDRGILCAEHDGALGDYDNYGITICREFGARASHPAPDIWFVPGVDGDRLVRFWLAILWRFSLSSLPEAAGVTLGPYEDVLRDILFAGADCFIEPAIFMLRYRSAVIPPENICFPPYASAFPGQPNRMCAYGIAVAGLHAVVKLDSQPLAPKVWPSMINGKIGIVGGYMQFEDTNQYPVMLQVAHNMGQAAACRAGPGSSGDIIQNSSDAPVTS